MKIKNTVSDIVKSPYSKLESLSFFMGKKGNFHLLIDFDR